MKTNSPLQWHFRSPIGSLYIIAQDHGLSGLYLKKQPVEMAQSLYGADARKKLLRQAENQLKEYFQCKRKTFHLPLLLKGTPFQKSVWKALQKIPYGKTQSYSDVATRIKNKKAVRAVGTANGENRFCIIIPCHRVIAANGGLGGYSGGLKIKAKLLAHENQELAPQSAPK